MREDAVAKAMVVDEAHGLEVEGLNSEITNLKELTLTLGGTLKTEKIKGVEEVGGLRERLTEAQEECVKARTSLGVMEEELSSTREVMEQATTDHEAELGQVMRERAEGRGVTIT